MAPLLQEAPGFPDEVVQAGIVAVYELTSARHGGLDVLNREERCVVPVGGLRAVFGHERQPSRWRSREAWRGSTPDGAVQNVAAPAMVHDEPPLGVGSDRSTDSASVGVPAARPRPPTARGGGQPGQIRTHAAAPTEAGVPTVA
jgi:hypothetical protein